MKDPSAASRRQFPKDLLAWYEANKRRLPWRESKDPYQIWVSEIMLQQTQVATVLPFFKRFIAEFPNSKALADAPLDRVLKLWEGLGYYSRARNLHKAAQEVVKNLGSSIPTTSAELQKLPGIGLYTSAAIASIAFDEATPVLDGNVKRGISRIFLIQGSLKSPRIVRKMEQEMKSLLPSHRPGDFNQAMMELGALICIPKTPKCEICPVSQHCGAFNSNLQNELPVKTPRKARPHHDIAVGIIWKGDKLLIAQRPENGLLGGLWEFPGGKREETESLEDCLHREIKEELGIEVRIEDQLLPVQHGYTHFKVTLHPFICAWSKGQPKALGCSKWKWVKQHELSEYAFPRANHKIFEMMQNLDHN